MYTNPTLYIYTQVPSAIHLQSSVYIYTQIPLCTYTHKCHLQSTCNQVDTCIHKSNSIHIYTSAICNPLAIKWKRIHTYAHKFIRIYISPTIYICTQVPLAITCNPLAIKCIHMYTSPTISTCAQVPLAIHLQSSVYIYTQIPLFTYIHKCHLQSSCNQVYTHIHKSHYSHIYTSAICNPVAIKCIHIYSNPTIYTYTQVPLAMRGGGLGSRPKKMYGERLGNGVE